MNKITLSIIIVVILLLLLGSGLMLGYGFDANNGGLIFGGFVVLCIPIIIGFVSIQVNNKKKK